MDDRFTRLPQALESRARTVRLGPSQAPALLIHPDWRNPAPFVVWLHGRTGKKELDPGRYLRWMRAGIATCAIDLPGHGQRYDADFHRPTRTPDTLDIMLAEIDEAIDALDGPDPHGVFDRSRSAIGGMSAGGMAVLRRLCDPHVFVCATVEATTGDLAGFYAPRPDRRGSISHGPRRIAPLDPGQHLETWRPIPILALHSEADRVVPVSSQRAFIEALRARYLLAGYPADLVSFITWPETGAPQEHIGFGRFANDAKNRQLAFLKRHLRPGPSRDCRTGDPGTAD